MRVESLTISDVKLVHTERYGDHRGFFSEVYSRAKYAEAGIPDTFIQDNHSMSAAKGTVRGLHFQHGPNAQAKLLRVAHGAILDVAVDIRVGSPTFGKHVAAELSAENWRQLYVPVGFAHGFCTLEPDTEVLYKVTAPYDPDHESAILWNDPALAIGWPVSPADATLSEKDAAARLLAELPEFFRYQA